MTKLLHDGNERFIPLADDEKTIISAFIGDDDHVMKMSEGLIEGDEIVVLKGPLMNHLGSVKKIDRHKTSGLSGNYDVWSQDNHQSRTRDSQKTLDIEFIFYRK